MVTRSFIVNSRRRSLSPHCSLVRSAFDCCRYCFGQQPNIVIVNIDDMGWGDFHVLRQRVFANAEYRRARVAGDAVHAILYGRADLLAFASGLDDRAICGAIRNQFVSRQYDVESCIATMPIACR